MSPASANRQPDLLPRSLHPTIPIAEDHKLVQLTDTLDWTDLEDQAQQIRSSLGVGFWKSREELARQWKVEKAFEPRMPQSRREDLYANWKRAVERSFHWAQS